MNVMHDEVAQPGEPAWQLIARHGGRDAPIELDIGQHTVGSSAECTIELRHPTVSKRHAAVRCTADSVTVEDLGSTNGTHVNGRPVPAATAIELTPGSTVSFGELGFVLARSAPSHRRGRLETPDLLGTTTIAELREDGEEAVYGPGEVIVRRGNRSEWLHVIVSGEVELALQDDGTHRRPLARLGPGATFGAESVLSDQTAAADAVALDTVHVLRYPASSLTTALEHSASLRRKLLRGMAHQFHEATCDVLDLLRGTEIITRLVQGDDEPAELISASARMRTVRKRIDRAASGRDRQPVLLVGESGTGKTLSARLIHEGSPYAGGPLIAVSCAKLAPEQAAELILGSQTAEGATSPHGGGIDLARGGTLLLKDVDSLRPSDQLALADCLGDVSSAAGGQLPATRVIASAGAVGEGNGTASRLEGPLLERFGHVIHMPALANRSRDILPLAEWFLERSSGPARELDDSARRALLAMSYRRRNVAELREVVELAVRVADGDQIRAEHIFSGIEDDRAPGIDVTTASPIALLTRGRVLAGVKLATAAGFIAVIGLCLLAGTTAAGRLANAGIWSVWEPVVFASFLLIGPLWCTICPLSSSSRWAQRRTRLERPPPEWMRRHGPWLAVAGFAAIVWSERFFDMIERPLGSGILLAALLGAAVLCGVAYSREVWCRHLCPLGRLAVTLAPAAPLELGANRSICASTCTGHECYRGTSTIPGCTVYHHPLEARESHRCKLCLDCLRSCPHGSARLRVRWPLSGLRGLDANARDLALFSLAVALLAGLLLLPVAQPGTPQPWLFTALCVATVAVGIAAHRLLLGAAESPNLRADTLIRILVAAMLLGWGALMASQLANISVLGSIRLTTDAQPPWLPAELPLVVVLQALVVLASFLAAAIALRTLRRTARNEEALGTLAWVTVHLLLLSYTVGVLVVVVGS